MGRLGDERRENFDRPIRKENLIPSGKFRGLECLVCDPVGEGRRLGKVVVCNSSAHGTDRRYRSPLLDIARVEQNSEVAEDEIARRVPKSSMASESVPPVIALTDSN